MFYSSYINVRQTMKTCQPKQKRLSMMHAGAKIKLPQDPDAWFDKKLNAYRGDQQKVSCNTPALFQNKITRHIPHFLFLHVAGRSRGLPAETHPANHHPRLQALSREHHNWYDARQRCATEDITNRPAPPPLGSFTGKPTTSETRHDLATQRRRHKQEDAGLAQCTHAVNYKNHSTKRNREHYQRAQ